MYLGCLKTKVLIRWKTYFLNPPSTSAVTINVLLILPLVMGITSTTLPSMQNSDATLSKIFLEISIKILSVIGVLVPAENIPASRKTT
jgi:hypothetical protein